MHEVVAVPSHRPSRMFKIYIFYVKISEWTVWQSRKMEDLLTLYVGESTINVNERNICDLYLLYGLPSLRTLWIGIVIIMLQVREQKNEKSE